MAKARDNLSLESVRDPHRLLALIVETPHLARAVPRLPAEILHRIIERCGLAECGDLAALATPRQLAAVFDLDLWRSAHPGLEETFDASRFGLWLEVLAASGAEVAAGQLAEMEIDVVVAGFSQYVAVFDPAALLPWSESGDDTTIVAPLDSLQSEIGGYRVVARRTDSWDAIVAVLAALDAGRQDCFHRVMRACRRLSDSAPEIDGLHPLLAASEQSDFDLALGRERRREKQGYATPAQARAFLQASRDLSIGPGDTPPRNPIVVAYFAALEALADGEVTVEPVAASASGDVVSLEQAESSMAAVVDALLDADVIPDRPRALLASGDEQPACARIHAHMEFVRGHDPAIYSRRSQELAFLANALSAGCSVQARTFTAQEAFDAAVATCNLGLEHWHPLPPAFLVDHDLCSVFQVGWAILYKEAGMFTAKRLLEVLEDLRVSDREIQMGLYQLRREMTRHLQKGTPWHARGALDVVAILDMPAWAALLGLIAECPVMLANVSAPASGVLSIDVSAFQFISERRQIALVRDFMQGLGTMLSQ
jgi:hypothetical protein